MNIKQHEDNWEDCQRCPLFESRFDVVLYRGNAIEDVDTCFIGEAPGIFENVVGYPFVGPAGRKLDKIIEAVQRDRREHGLLEFSYTITNIIACYPPGVDSAFRPPNKLEIQSCSPRLLEFQEIVKPKSLILLGEIPTENLSLATGITPIPVLELYHPSYLIRNETKELELTLDCIADLTCFLEEVL